MRARSERPRPSVQRSCACSASKDPCEACARSSEPTRLPSSVGAALSATGQPLDPSTRATLEPRFGHDFGRVRVHTDARAAESARAVGALAYTVGRDIVFGAGQYAPATPSGRKLLAHELTHTLQQGHGLQRAPESLSVSQPGDAAEREAEATAEAVSSDRPVAHARSAPPQVARQEGASTAPAGPTSAPTTDLASAPTAPATPPTYGKACSTGPDNPCRQSRCPQPNKVPADLDRALGYVDRAVAALGSSPLSDSTRRAMDWYFNAHDAATVSTVKNRLGCISDRLTDARTNQRWGCHPDDDATAYVCVGAIPICGDAFVDICLTSHYFRHGDRSRAQTLIHECAHRAGMSLGSAHDPDIYQHSMRFLYMDTSETLHNSDSYALFAGAIAEGVPLSLVGPIVGLSAGTAGPSMWYARVYGGIELQHPVLSLFNPTLGLGMSVIGAPAIPEGSRTRPDITLLYSLLTGIRLGLPRPGAAGGAYTSLSGGPTLALGTAGPRQFAVGAEVGLAAGYRWRWLDASLGAGYMYVPTEPGGRRHLTLLGGTVTFIVGQ